MKIILYELQFVSTTLYMYKYQFTVMLHDGYILFYNCLARKKFIFVWELLWHSKAGCVFSVFIFTHTHTHKYTQMYINDFYIYHANPLNWARDLGATVFNLYIFIQSIKFCAEFPGIASCLVTLFTSVLRVLSVHFNGIAKQISINTRIISL